jgi:NADH-quinone oxidoreductase subunit E/NADP-reducing hydrogenase subunit HndA
MSNDWTAELPGSTREPREFFGSQEAQPTEQIDAAIWKMIDDYLIEHPGGRERLIPLLHMAQKQLGYLPFAVQEYVADRVGLSPVQVYGVVSFYQLFTTTPRAPYQIKVCMGTACFVRNGQRLLEALRDACAVDVGGISEDGLFNLDQVRCIGACGLAPAIMINDEVYGNLTPTKVRRLVRRLRKEAKAQASEQREGDGGENIQ